MTSARTEGIRGRGRVLVALVAMLGLVVTGLAPTVAYAAESSLRIDKRVDGLETQDALGPGDEFTYTVDLFCDDVDCVNVVMTDTLPAQFAGFELVGTSVSPADLPLTATTTGCVEEGGVPVEVSDDCTVAVVFQQPVDGGVGLEAGGTLKLSVVLRAPLDLPADWEFNGDTVTNTATADWDNGPGDVPATIEDSADAVVTVDTVIGIEASKSWTPASQQFDAGDISTITIGAQNQSNLGGDALVVQEPSGAVDGAAELGADNPFRIVDFAGFTASTLPPDATTVQVDVYTFDEGTGTWSWQPGTPGTAPALPTGVDPGDVGGIRLTYAGGTIAGDASASSAFTVEQRADDRNTGATLAAGASVTNSITGTVEVPGQEPVSDEATAPFEITPLTVAVAASKTITPAELAAGGEATAALAAENTSNGPVQSLTISDLDFFDADMVFGGFPAGIAYPEGAAGATITWYVDGIPTAPVPFGDGDAPEPPPGVVTGFVLEFTGDIPAGADAAVDVTVLPTLALVSEESPVASRTNTIDVSATNDVGTATDDASADITVYFPEIAINLEKNIAPGGAVEPGNSVVAGLTATTGTGAAQVFPTEIVVEDTWRDDQADDFWNAFDIVAIAPTQVPPNTTLTVEYQRPDGSWATLAVETTGDTAATFQMSRAEFAAALTPPDAPSDVTGIRFTFDNAEGFPKGFSVEPNIVFDARSDLRDGSGPTDPRDEPEDDPSAQQPTVYENEATSQSHADVTGLPGGIDSDVVDAQDTIGVETPATGVGPGVDVVKSWVETGDKTTGVDFVDSQSGQVVSTRNEWRTGTRGVQSLTISDPPAAPGGDPAAPASTVFQAFDLLSVDPITLAQDPLLAWDDITEVALFVGGAWVVIPAPGGSWMGSDGSFVGYVLTPEQTIGTTGVRIVYAPDDAARTASVDPTTPEPGSGLATSAVGQYRPTFLTWELRNVVRDDTGLANPWVTADQTFNDAGPGSVVNTVRGDWTTADGTGSDTESDTIAFIDQPPLVSVTKTATPGTVTIPESADVAPENYPNVVFRLDARNDSTARASYVRVTDPLTCAPGDVPSCLTAADAWGDDPFEGAKYDPATNPYERLSVQGLVFTVPSEQVDRDDSLVTLWDRSDGGALSTRTLSITAAEALAAPDLASVVGISVVYQGADPAAEGGSIDAGATLRLDVTTKVRQYERSDAAQLVQPGTVDNTVIAQSYDPVLEPSGPASRPGDTAGANVELISALLDVTLAKTLSPDALIESELDTPVTVTLDATDGESTASSQQVTITDQDPEFWNTVRLADAPNLAVALPAGADEVRIDALVGTTWVEGAFGPTAALPAVALDGVVGVRAVFRNAAGTAFSAEAPPADWTAQLTFDVLVLDTLRDGSPLPLPVDVPNTATASSERLDGLYATVEKDAEATLVLDPGTHAIDVVKTQPGTSHVVGIGSSLPWTLTFANVGTGYLTVDDLVDTLPEYLEWDFSTPVYATSAGGTLSTDVSAVADGTGKVITFSWPESGDRMSPGEVFTITINLSLTPGLSLDGFATNTFVVTTDETLGACTNTSGNGEGTVAGLDDDQCGTTNYVQPQPGGSLSATKYVKGEIDGDLVDGQVNLNNPDAACPLDAEGYTRTPCAASTAVGATDDWKLRVLNSGTVGFPTVSIVDPLPRIGDRMLATGSARNTTFAPVLVAESLEANSLPEGAVFTLDVTTSTSPCTGTGPGSAWFGDLLCDTTATWTPVASYAGAWEDVTGIRVTIDFSGTAAGSFPPGGTLELHYETRNEPESEAYPDLAPISVPDAGGVAWNQMGAVGTDADGRAYSVAPVQAGVMLYDGDLGVEKVLEGDIGQAPASFDFLVECTVASVALVLPDAGVVSVSADAGLETRVNGLPLGSSCTVTEQGPVGAYAEGSRRGDGQTIDIVTPSVDGDDIPVIQTASITNVYIVPPVDPPSDPATGGDEAGGGLPGTGGDGTQAIALVAFAVLLLLVGGAAAYGRRKNVGCPLSKEAVMSDSDVQTPLIARVGGAWLSGD